MGKYFGTDGFRGEANVDLTVEHAYQVGRFLGMSARMSTVQPGLPLSINPNTPP